MNERAGRGRGGAPRAALDWAVGAHGVVRLLWGGEQRPHRQNLEGKELVHELTARPARVVGFEFSFCVPHALYWRE